MKESDFMTLFTNNKHQNYRFEYKKDHILIDKFYNTTNKYAPYTSILSRTDLTEDEFNKICEDWSARKMREEDARAANKHVS